MTDIFTVMESNAITYLFGSNLVAGLFLLIVFSWLCFKMGLSADGFIVVLFPLLGLIVGVSYGTWLGFGYLPTWFMTVITIVIGIVISMAVKRMVQRG